MIVKLKWIDKLAIILCLVVGIVDRSITDAIFLLCSYGFMVFLFESLK